MKIVILQLITGEQLLGDLLVNGPEVVSIKNPVAIMVVPNPKDPRTPSVGLAPWGQFSNKREFNIQKQHILTVIDEPVEDFITQYKSMFGGIITPNSKLILPS